MPGGAHAYISLPKAACAARRPLALLPPRSHLGSPSLPHDQQRRYYDSDKFGLATVWTRFWRRLFPPAACVTTVMPALQVLPAGEADMRRFAAVQTAAFFPEPATPVLFLGPTPPDALDAKEQEFIDELRKPTTVCFKAVDSTLDGDEQAIAFAKWGIYVDGHPKRPIKEWPAPACNPEACNALFGGMQDMNVRLMGKTPHIYLSILATDPKRQGRGAGSMLLQWGIEEGARRGLPVYLVATEAGHPLYLKKKFHDVEVFSTDFSKWGLKEPHKLWAMLRDPQ